MRWFARHAAAGAPAWLYHFSSVRVSQRGKVPEIMGRMRAATSVIPGIRTLMLSAKTLIRNGGELAVCGASESVEKVLRTTGFNEVAGIYPDYESAARTLRERLGAFSTKKA